MGILLFFYQFWIFFNVKRMLFKDNNECCIKVYSIRSGIMNLSWSTNLYTFISLFIYVLKYLSLYLNL